MDAGLMLYNNLKDVKWSATSLPLDRLVSSYRLPQIVKLNTGESVEGLRDNDYILLHSCRQWTTITAHSLEEGHYVIGPKIEIPVHYGGARLSVEMSPFLESRPPLRPSPQQGEVCIVTKGYSFTMSLRLFSINTDNVLLFSALSTHRRSAQDTAVRSFIFIALANLALANLVTVSGVASFSSGVPSFPWRLLLPLQTASAGQYFHDYHPEVEEFRVVVLCMERTLSSSDVNTAPMCSIVVKST
ncbi:UNVERIFIED_CONTAM: hypothetical protein FKN15_016342 [Acipenser sinensis]